MFSIEIKKKFSIGISLLDKVTKYIPIGEFFFVHNPMQFSEVNRFRISVEPTFGKEGNSVVTDYGIDNPVLQISGEFNLLFEGRPETKNPLALPLLNAIGPRTGRMEFEDFLGLLFFSRYATYIPATIELAGIAAFLAAKPLNHRDYAVIWNDYDRDRRVEIAPDPGGITISRDIQDSFCVKFSGNFIVVNDLNQSISLLRVFRNPLNTIRRLTGLAQSIVNLPLSFTNYGLGLANIWTEIKDAVPNIVSTYDKMKSQFSKDGILIKKQFNTKVVSRKLDSIDSKLDYYDRQINNVSQSTLTENTRTVNPPLISNQSKDVEESSSYLNKKTGETILSYPGLTLEEIAIREEGSDFTNWILLDSYEALLAIEETMQGIQSSMQLAEHDSSFRVIQAIPGDSFETISRRELGDESLAVALSEYNKIPITAKLDGKFIKIPDDSRKSEIFSRGPVDSEKNLARRVLGEDLALTPERGIKIDYNGDLATEEGEGCLISNLIDLLEIPDNSLPLHPDWGNPYQPGEVYNSDAIPLLAKKLSLVLKQDSRVKSVDSSVITQDSDNAEVDFSIQTFVPLLPKKIRFSGILYVFK